MGVVFAAFFLFSGDKGARRATGLSTKHLEVNNMLSTKKITLTALFIACAIALPLAFHTIPNAGQVFLPMHIPVLICGLVCGFPYGTLCGLIAPLLSSLLTGMPAAIMLPQMLCELTVYGFVSAVCMRFAPVRNPYARTYAALIGAMAAGRLVYGALNALIFRAGTYSFEIWLSAALLTALPGIAIQLFFIPAAVAVLQKAKLAEAWGRAKT